MSRGPRSQGGAFINEYGEIVRVGINDIPSDFDQLREDLHEAYQSPDGVRSDLAAAVAYNQIVKDRKDGEAVPVTSSPLSVLKNPDPKFGSFVTVTAAAIGSINSAPEVVRWSGETGESRVCTVSMGWGPTSITLSGQLTLSTATTINRPYAIITYGTRNFTKTVVVDIGPGRQVSFVASFVTVQVGLELPSGGTVYGTATLGASLGFGAVTGLGPAIRTIYVDSYATPSTPTTWYIPTSAVALLPIQRTPTSNALTILFYDYAGNLIFKLYGGDTDYSFMTAPLYLPDDAAYFQITNTGGATTTARFPFQLAL